MKMTIDLAVCLGVAQNSVIRIPGHQLSRYLSVSVGLVLRLLLGGPSTTDQEQRTAGKQQR